MRFIIRILISALIGVGAFTYLYYGENGQLPQLNESGLTALWSALIAVECAWAIFWVSNNLNRFLPWKKYFTIRFIGSLVINALICVFIVSLFGWLYLIIPDSTFEATNYIAEHTDSILKLAVLSFCALFVYNITDFAFYSYNEYARGQIESVKLEREHLELQFEALKTQLSPHYLFNCLNTISSLVDQNAEYAETFIRRLVQTYQYILDSKDKRLTSVSEEIEFVKAYQFLLKVRFGDAMRIEFDLKDEIFKTLIPPLTIQILIENAVKHNEISEEDPMEIVIKADPNGFIIVSNHKSEIVTERDVESFKIGLDNIRKRYSYFTDRPITVVDNHVFEVKLPLIPAA
ncbi:MAG: histidine kinase [Cyclobacteriaceae bacterium]